MKTTVEITESLFVEARNIAHRDGTTLRELIEEGLRRVIDDRSTREPYLMPDCSVSGNGLQPEFKDASWEQIRDAVYEGHGA